MRLMPGTQRDSCCACGSSHALSRRGFLCTSIAAAAAVPGLVASAGARAQAQPTVAPGRPLLIKNGCVLSLDPMVGDFERADVMISGTKIVAVGPNLSAPDASCQPVPVKPKGILAGGLRAKGRSRPTLT